MNYEARLARLREELDRPLLITSLSNIRYLTGFTGSNAFLYVSDSGGTFVTDGRYGEVAASLTAPLPDIDLEVYAVSAEELLAPIIDSGPAVSIEAEHASWSFVRNVRDKTSAELIATSGIVENLRKVKDDDEIRALEAAAAAGDAAFSELSDLAAAAATEGDLGVGLIEAMRRAGGEQAGWPPIVAVGANASLPHHRAGTAKIPDEGLLLLDYGCVVDGYHSDMSRTVWLGGSADTEMDRVYGATLEAQEAGIAAVRPGVTGKEVDEACRAVLRQYGYEMHFIHSTGHGVGLDIHEGPRLAKTSNDTLEPGHVVTVEPGVYLQGRGGVRVEDMVLVTPNGRRVLTKSAKDFHQ